MGSKHPNVRKIVISYSPMCSLKLGNIGSLVDIMKFCIRNRDTLKNPKKKLEKIKQFNIVKISNKFCNVIENLK